MNKRNQKTNKMKQNKKTKTFGKTVIKKIKILILTLKIFLTKSTKLAVK